ncbi:MAG TPA: thymidylate synthase [Pyrinomonadaceae bacterium]|nr:thymidylate synthase [Pyrinomonadaceae bacterium]
MKQYHDLLKSILANGTEHQDRTGVGTISHFGFQTRFDLREGFPIVTTKKIPFRWVAEELFWFLSGDTNEANLRAKGVDIWAEWADEKHTRRFSREAGDLGPVYGYLWRSFGGDYPERNGVDQIARLMTEIEGNANSRRLIVTGWDPRQADQVDLPPCHTLFQFKVDRGRLHCQLYQRSADAFLGVPFNISSYALLMHMIAHVSELEPGEFVYTLGDYHIYQNHLEQVEELLARDPLPLPQLEIIDEGRRLRGLEGLVDFQYDNLKLVGYQSHGKISAAVAI